MGAESQSPSGPLMPGTLNPTFWMPPNPALCPFPAPLPTLKGKMGFCKLEVW